MLYRHRIAAAWRTNTYAFQTPPFSAPQDVEFGRLLRVAGDARAGAAAAARRYQLAPGRLSMQTAHIVPPPMPFR